VGILHYLMSCECQLNVTVNGGGSRVERSTSDFSSIVSTKRRFCWHDLRVWDDAIQFLSQMR